MTFFKTATTHLLALMLGMFLVVATIIQQTWVGNINVMVRQQYTAVQQIDGARFDVRCNVHRPLLATAAAQAPVNVLAYTYAGNTMYMGSNAFLVNAEFATPYKTAEMLSGSFSYMGYSRHQQDDSMAKSLTDACLASVGFSF